MPGSCCRYCFIEQDAGKNTCHSIIVHAIFSSLADTRQVVKVIVTVVRAIRVDFGEQGACFSQVGFDALQYFAVVSRAKSWLVSRST